MYISTTTVDIMSQDMLIENTQLDTYRHRVQNTHTLYMHRNNTVERKRELTCVESTSTCESDNPILT